MFKMGLSKVQNSTSICYIIFPRRLFWLLLVLIIFYYYDCTTTAQHFCSNTALSFQYNIIYYLNTRGFIQDQGVVPAENV